LPAFSNLPKFGLDNDPITAPWERTDLGHLGRTTVSLLILEALCIWLAQLNSMATGLRVTQGSGTRLFFRQVGSVLNSPQVVNRRSRYDHTRGTASGLGRLREAPAARRMGKPSALALPWETPCHRNLPLASLYPFCHASPSRRTVVVRRQRVAKGR